LLCPARPAVVFIGCNQHGQNFYWLKDKAVTETVWSLGGVGLVGADVTAEQEVMGLTGEAVASIDGLRYALAGRPETEQRFWTKLKYGEPPIVGTTYPNVVRTFFRGRVEVLYTPGSAEVLPYLRPEVDAIGELVRTGGSLRANGLKVFMDNIASVALMLVRPIEFDTIKKGMKEV
jgi:ATP phosphoribosyltransferase